MATFGSRLRELLDGAEIQYKDFAKLLKVAPSTISNWLSGERFPNDEKILMFLADYFDVTLDYLLGRTDDKDTIVVKNNVDGHDIEIGVDRKDYPNGLTPKQVEEVFEELRAFGFDVNKLIDRIKDSK